MRLVNKLVALLTEDSDQLYKTFDQERFLDDSDLTTERTGRFTIAASVTDQQFDFGGVTNAKYVLILATNEIQVAFNGTTPKLTLEPLSAESNPLSDYQKTAQPGVFFIGPTDITSLYFSNPSGSAPASVYVALMGEAS